MPATLEKVRVVKCVDCDRVLGEGESAYKDWDTGRYTCMSCWGEMVRKAIANAKKPAPTSGGGEGKRP